MLPNLGLCSWSLRGTDAPALVTRLRTLEIEFVQLALVPCIDDERWAGGVEYLRGEGIGIVSGMLSMAGEDYSTLGSIALTGGVRSDAHWGENLDRALRVAEFANKHAIDLVTLHAGFIPHTHGDRLRAVMLDRLRTVADIFAQRGIAIALETGQEAAETLAEALDELDRPTVGVNFDPANMILYGMGDPVEAVARLSPWLRQVHIKDATPTLHPGTWGTEVAVGSGSVEWTPFLDSVKRARTPTRQIDLIIERESGACTDDDIVAARDLVRRHMCTIV